MATLIQIRRDSQASWISNDPVLALGELAYSTDVSKLKAGNGSSLWSELPYINVLPSEIDNLETDDIPEGALNFYFTEFRAQQATPGRITASTTKPSSPLIGDGWLDVESGFLYVYIDDGNSVQWIQA